MLGRALGLILVVCATGWAEELRKPASVSYNPEEPPSLPVQPGREGLEELKKNAHGAAVELYKPSFETAGTTPQLPTCMTEFEKIQPERRRELAALAKEAAPYAKLNASIYTEPDNASILVDGVWLRTNNSRVPITYTSLWRPQDAMAEESLVALRAGSETSDRRHIRHGRAVRSDKDGI